MSIVESLPGPYRAHDAATTMLSSRHAPHPQHRIPPGPRPQPTSAPLPRPFAPAQSRPTARADRRLPLGNLPPLILQHTPDARQRSLLLSRRRAVVDAVGSRNDDGVVDHDACFVPPCWEAVVVRQSCSCSGGVQVR